jgi:phosphatidylinositol alpha-mannosyltransferase
MRIALVSPYDYSVPGGVNNHISHLATEFTHLGHEARILVPSSDRDVANVHVINASSSIMQVPFAGSIARISLDPRVYRRTKRILQEGGYDVLHLHEPLMPMLPLAVLRHHDLVPKAICVGTFHAYREVSRAYYYGAPVLRRFFKRLDGHITVSEAARQYHLRYFPADYAVIPNGVDVEHFNRADLRPIDEFADGPPNILFVGRLEKRKGLPHLIEAFVHVKREMPDVRLIVVGAYDELDKVPFRLRVRFLGLTDVHFVGRVTDEELARYYRTADVFCAPSTGMESFGMVLLEAMAAGAPVVASDIEGYREVVDDGAQGVLVRPEDPEALAAALVSLLRDPARRRAMSAAGREKAQLYSWRVIAARVLEYYGAIRERVCAAAALTTRAVKTSIQTVEKPV